MSQLLTAEHHVDAFLLSSDSAELTSLFSRPSHSGPLQMSIVCGDHGDSSPGV